MNSLDQSKTHAWNIL